MDTLETGSDWILVSNLAIKGILLKLPLRLDLRDSYDDHGKAYVDMWLFK